MTYTQRMWLRWADRLVVVVSLVCLALGLAVDAKAQDVAQGPRIVREVPYPVMRFASPRGVDLAVIESDGVLAFDYGGTIAWSRYFVAEAPPAKCRPVWVLTWINGPDGRRALYLQGCEPVQPKVE